MLGSGADEAGLVERELDDGVVGIEGAEFEVGDGLVDGGGGDVGDDEAEKDLGDLSTDHDHGYLSDRVKTAFVRNANVLYVSL